METVSLFLHICFRVCSGHFMNLYELTYKVNYCVKILGQGGSGNSRQVCPLQGFTLQNTLPTADAHLSTPAPDITLKQHLTHKAPQSTATMSWFCARQ